LQPFSFQPQKANSQLPQVVTRVANRQLAGALERVGGVSSKGRGLNVQRALHPLAPKCASILPATGTLTIVSACNAAKLRLGDAVLNPGWRNQPVAIRLEERAKVHPLGAFSLAGTLPIVQSRTALKLRNTEMKEAAN
jgi:hypothetical protein